MLLSKSFLNQEAMRRSISEYSKQTIINENSSKRARTLYDIFLTHSYLDKVQILTLVKLFNESGYSVYVDWLVDSQLDRSNVTKYTVQTLRQRLISSKGLAYVATKNSTDSKWCPWELGFCDGHTNGKCGILPVLENYSTTFEGVEYLGVYPNIQYEYKNGTYDFWIYGSSIYPIVLSQWLNG